MIDSRAGCMPAVNKIFLFLYIVLLAALPNYAIGASEKEVGNVRDLRGSANIIRETKTVDAGRNDPVFRADTVKTRDKSKMKLLFIDDSLLMIGENSTVSISTHLDKKGKTNVFNLMDGVVNVIVGKSGLEVHTPTSVTAARGTSYVVWVEGGAEKTGVAVAEGRVDIRNRDETVGEKVLVPAGKMTFIERGKAPAPAVVAPPEVIQVLYKKTLEQEEIWGPVILRAKGGAIPPPDAASPAQARLMALRAAKVEALRNLLEQAYGVTILSGSTVRDFTLKNDAIKTRVDGFVRGAWVSEERLLADGSYEVEMELGLGIGFRRAFLEGADKN